MYKRQFDLEQHTPQLHFEQHTTRKQTTLRATEVKPKLDRYLLKMLGDNVHPDWKRETEQKDVSLDYEMRLVLAEGAKPLSGWDMEAYLPGKEGRKEKIKDGMIIQKGSNSLVMANMRKPEDEKKYFVHYQNANGALPSHHLNIFSYHPELLAEIESHIADFLLTHNFGNRQTKGFGSYYLFPGSLGYKAPVWVWSFTVSAKNDAEGLEEVFWQISLLWKAMRAGINDGIYNKPLGRYIKNTFYFKSLMFMYARHLGIQWDKKTIKEKFFLGELKKQPYETVDNDENSPLNYSVSDKYLMKDLLGLSSLEGWGNVYNQAEIKKKHQPGPKDGEIERFASPILFKPIFSADRKTCKIHLILSEIPEEIHNANFEVKKGNNGFPLSFPDSNVRIQDFFDYLFAKNQQGGYSFDLNNHVETGYTEHEKFTKLKTIIEEIRDNHALHISQTPPPNA